MLTNATILRITPATIDAGGAMSWAPAAGVLTPEVSALRKDPGRQARWQLGAQIEDCTAQIRVKEAELARAGVTQIAVNDRVEIQMDGSLEPEAFVVVVVKRLTWVGMSNWLVFGRRV